MKSGPLIATIAALSLACARAPTLGAEIDPSAAAAQLARAHRIPDTLTAQGKAFVDAPRNGGRYPFQVSVQRPASLRIAVLDPLGNPAAVLVAQDGLFSMLDTRANVYYRGPATAENLSRLIPAPLRDEELVALLLGAPPPLRGAVPVSAHRLGDGTLIVFAGPDGMSQEISAGGDLRIEAVRRFHGKDLLWSAALEDHDDLGGAQMPRLIRFSIPPQQTQVELALHQRLVGKPPPFGAFQLGPPSGVRVVELH